MKLYYDTKKRCLSITNHVWKNAKSVHSSEAVKTVSKYNESCLEELKQGK